MYQEFSKCFACIISFNLKKSPMKYILYYSHLQMKNWGTRKAVQGLTVGMWQSLGLYLHRVKGYAFNHYTHCLPNRTSNTARKPGARDILRLLSSMCSGREQRASVGLGLVVPLLCLRAPLRTPSFLILFSSPGPGKN